MSTGSPEAPYASAGAEPVPPLVRGQSRTPPPLKTSMAAAPQKLSLRESFLDASSSLRVQGGQQARGFVDFGGFDVNFKDLRAWHAACLLHPRAKLSATPPEAAACFSPAVAASPWIRTGRVRPRNSLHRLLPLRLPLPFAGVNFGEEGLRIKGQTFDWTTFSSSSAKEK